VTEEGDYSLASGMTRMRLFSYEIEKFLAGARNEEPSPALRDELTERNLQPNGKMQEMRERI
jgi:hypothetical protein